MAKSILDGAPPDLQKMMIGLWADIQRSSNQMEREAARKDPAKHRLSKVMEDGAGYRFFSAKNGRGSTVRFCYSTGRNVAGFFLIWREVVTKKLVKRDQWDSTRSKADAILACRNRVDVFRAAQKKAVPDA